MIAYPMQAGNSANSERTKGGGGVKISNLIIYTKYLRARG
jgi:hypothetical protein